jgi:inhibitor of cysteine peptidase
MFRFKMLIFAALAMSLMAACAQIPATATPSPIVTEVPTGLASVAVVKSIEILLLESFPLQVHAVLRGDLPDAGCTTIASVDQVRDGNTFKLNLITTTDPLALCAQALTPFEEVVPLEVQGLPAGTYTVQVGSVTQTFEFTVDNSAEQPIDTDVYPTDVKYVMALQDVPIHSGVGGSGNVIGEVFSGQVAQVTGTNFDGKWWQIVCPDNAAGSCWVSADPAFTEPTTPPHENQPTPPGGTPQATDVQFVMAQQDVQIYGGPGDEHGIVGNIASGQTAKVTGVSADKKWWRVICPDDAVGDCWVSADPAFTQPSEGLGGNPTADGSVQPTNVQYVMAQEDVLMRSGPGTQFSVIGNIASGQVGKVTGVSVDAKWWRVICPDDTVGNCWVSADTSLTQPAESP